MPPLYPSQDNHTEDVSQEPHQAYHVGEDTVQDKVEQNELLVVGCPVVCGGGMLGHNAAVDDDLKSGGLVDRNGRRRHDLVYSMLKRWKV